MTPHEPSYAVPINIYLSCAANDESLMRDLVGHLAGLKRTNAISLWSAQDITPGEEWKPAIEAKLNTARVILLLVSADFLASDSCMEHETAGALARSSAREATVIPILLRPCDWKLSSFAHLPTFPANGPPVTDWANRDQAWTHIVTEIRRVVEGMQVGSVDDAEVNSSRFLPGINPFEYGPTVPSDRFAGRRSQREDVRARLGGVAAQSISLVGLRRSGKSSMFRYKPQPVREP